MVFSSIEKHCSYIFIFPRVGRICGSFPAVRTLGTPLLFQFASGFLPDAFSYIYGRFLKRIFQFIGDETGVEFFSEKMRN